MIKKSIEETLILSVLEFSQKLKQNGDKLTQQFGITTQQWLVLLHLADDPNIPFLNRNQHEKAMMASELAESLNVSRPNITNLINALLTKGLISQVEDNLDRRRKRLILTKKGQSILDKIEPHRKKANTELFAHLSKKNQKDLLDSIQGCIEKLIRITKE